jgi:hypothetical protein
MNGISRCTSYAKPFLVPDEKEDDDHCSAHQMVIGVLPQQAKFGEHICKHVDKASGGRLCFGCADGNGNGLLREWVPRLSPSL